MMPKKTFCTGFVYTNEQWTDYWEGTQKRDNGNIGSVTTQSLVWMGTFGITDKINIIAMAPYIWTKASAGTLMPMEGVQDLTVAVKYNFYKKLIAENKLKMFGALSYSTPLTDYSPDFYPLSLGSSTNNLSWRLTGNYALKNGIYVNASAAYTWRSNTTLDRGAYYDDGQMYYTNEVRMPNVFDAVVNVGYHTGALQVDLNFTQMNTLGGSDIRKQDMPFVSNRMNASKLGCFVMYYVSVPKGLAVRAGGNLTLAGRNVGAATAVFGGLFYTIKFANESI
jgi:hypothetical protein